VEPAKTDFQPDPNSQFFGNLEQVIISQKQVQLSRGEHATLDISVNVPKEVDFTKGPLIYLVAVTSGTRRAVVQYLKIYLWGKKTTRVEVESIGNTVSVGQTQ
jgi:hypothetical protein